MITLFFISVPMLDQISQVCMPSGRARKRINAHKLRDGIYGFGCTCAVHSSRLSSSSLAEKCFAFVFVLSSSSSSLAQKHFVFGFVFVPRFVFVPPNFCLKTYSMCYINAVKRDETSKMLRLRLRPTFRLRLLLRLSEFLLSSSSSSLNIFSFHLRRTKTKMKTNAQHRAAPRSRSTGRTFQYLSREPHGP